MQIPLIQPQSLGVEAGQDPYEIEMATSSEKFKSFVSYMNRSKQLGEFVKRVILDLAGNIVVKRVIDGENKSWSKRKHR